MASPSHSTKAIREALDDIIKHTNIMDQPAYVQRHLIQSLYNIAISAHDDCIERIKDLSVESKQVSNAQTYGLLG